MASLCHINPDKSAVVLPQRGRAPALQQALSAAAAQRGAGRTPAATTATLVVGTPMGEESEVSKRTSDMLLSPKILKLLDGSVGLHEVDTQVACALLCRVTGHTPSTQRAAVPDQAHIAPSGRTLYGGTPGGDARALSG